MSKKPSKPSKVKRIPRSVQLAKAVSRRFANPQQELKIQTTAGIIREAVAGKGGHNKPRVPFKKVDGKREKKVPYKWGTLGLSEVAEAQKKDHNLISRVRRRRISRHLGNTFVAYTTGKTITQLPFKVIKRAAKADAYKAKITSRKWRKAAGDR